MGRKPDSSKSSNPSQPSKSSQPSHPQEPLHEALLDDAFSNDKDTDSVSLEDAEKIPDDDDDDQGEDLFDPVHLQKDYEPRPDLDYYHPALVDDAEIIKPMRASQKRRAERELELRDQFESALRGQSRAQHPGFLVNLGFPGDSSGEEDTDAELWNIICRRRQKYRDKTTFLSMIPVQQAEQAKEELPYCQNQTSWTQRAADILTLIFTGFLTSYRLPVKPVTLAQSQQLSMDTSQNDDQEGVYLSKISEMVHADRQSLHVQWEDLRQYCPKVCDWLYHTPANTLQVLDWVATKITREKYPQLYQHRRVSCQLKGYTIIDTLKSLDTTCLHRLVCVRAVVIRASNIIPKLQSVYFECNRCHCSTNGPYECHHFDVMKVKPVCEDCQSTASFTVSRERTIYENYQRLTLQQQPNQVTPGHLPRQKEAIVLGELVDTVRPGEEVVITGIYQTKPDARLNAQTGFPVLASHILVNNIDKCREMQIEEITEEDLRVIHKLSQNPNIRDKLIDTIAPSLWGHRHIKTALASAMFGGVAKKSEGNHNIRGDINVLILGDPGMGKSQFLKYVEKTFDRTIYTTGKGASGVGLTAAVRKDPITREYCLEGGGLVLADEGICLIDEFDKMGDQDRVSIHEAMEQQTISISKAGIVATLRARCAIIAAANPVYGKYNSSLTFAENVNLSDPILSRFDILAIVKDQVNPTQDAYLAQYVVGTHTKSHQLNTRVSVEGPNLEGGAGAMHRTSELHDNEEDDDDEINLNAKWIEGPGKIPQAMLKKYIIYARMNYFPQLRLEDESRLTQFYSEIREAASYGGGIPMTVRHLESVMRIATANAKMRLSRFVQQQDLNFAISTILESFIQSQKYAVAASLCKRFGRYRALASSPNEFLETVLVDLFSRKCREILRAETKGRQKSADLEQDDILLFNKARVPLADWVTVVRALYNVPEAAVHKYVQTTQFKSQYVIEPSLVQRLESAEDYNHACGWTRSKNTRIAEPLKISVDGSVGGRWHILYVKYAIYKWLKLITFASFIHQILVAVLETRDWNRDNTNINKAVRVRPSLKSETMFLQLRQKVSQLKASAALRKQQRQRCPVVTTSPEALPTPQISPPIQRVASIQPVDAVVQLRVPKEASFFRKVWCPCHVCASNGSEIAERFHRHSERVKAIGQTSHSTATKRCQHCPYLVRFEPTQQLPRRPILAKPVHHMSPLIRSIRGPKTAHDFFNQSPLQFGFGSLAGNSSRIFGSADWTAEVIVIFTSLNAYPRQFYNSLRIAHFLGCKGVEYFSIDMNNDNQLYEAANIAALRWKLNGHLFLDPTKLSQKKNILVPQILVDGIPIGSYEELCGLEDDYDLDYILAREICANCLAERAGLSSPQSIGSTTTAASSDMTYCGCCGAIFREFVHPTIIPQPQIDDLVSQNLRHLSATPPMQK